MHSGFLVLPQPMDWPESDLEEAPGRTTGQAYSPIPTFSKLPKRGFHGALS